jgi:DNA polymerase-1
MTERPAAKTLYLIDGHAQFFRAYHAIRPGTMSSPVTKEPTNLVFGFVATLIKTLREFDPAPQYVGVVIDVAGDRETFRSAIYPEYKATRDPAPEDFHPQVERCLEVLRGMSIPVIGLPGVEADDVIATLVRRLEAADPDLHVVVISKDKDLTQLISDRVRLFDIHKDQPVTPESVFGVPGVTPQMVPDVLALMGDTVDNVPGIPGVGPKTAGQWIVQYGSIDGLYAHLDEIKGKKRESLEASRDLVRLSRRLVALKDDCEINADLQQFRFDRSRIDVPGLQDLFRLLGFGRHQQEIAALAKGVAVADLANEPPAARTRRDAPISVRTTADDSTQVSSGRHDPPTAGGSTTVGIVREATIGDTLFEQSREAKPHAAIASPPGEYQCIVTEHDLSQIIREIQQAGFVSIDTETDGLSPVSANLCGVSLSVRQESGWYVPTRSPDPASHLDTARVMNALRPVIEDTAIRKIGQNLKFDINVLRTHGARLRGIAFDAMIASYVIDATRSSHGMDALAKAFLNHDTIRLTDLIGTGKSQKTFDQVPLDLATTYSAEDADVTLRLRDMLDPMLDVAGLRDLFEKVEMPLVEVLAELEYNGIRVDPGELDRQRDRLSEQIAVLRRQIVDHAPHPFNPDSPKQLAAALFNRPEADPPGLGLKVVKRGKTGPSTDVEVLEKLAADPAVGSEIPALIVEYRQLTKLVNTYLVALREAINPRTGRVHASFNQTVAATGRLSSSDPNLQNIPIRTDVGREIRRAFVADPGNLLIAADYSQIELRILAHLSEDPALIEAFHRDADIHTAVAAEVYGIKPFDVTSAQRNSAKMINFGIVYGITPFGLSRRLGEKVTVDDAARIIADYKHRFNRINAFLDRCVHEAETKGYVETMLGRRRAIPQIYSRNPQEKALGERVAINSVVQGSAADLIKLAMIDLFRAMPSKFPSARMLLQIHDELVFEASQAEAEPARQFVVERMELAMSLKVPLKVGSAVAVNWIDA